MSKLVNRLPSYTMEDGTLIQESPMSGAGWKGVALNPWSEEYPFIAIVSPGQVEDENLTHLVESFNANSHMIHMGWFSDEREAAYVAALTQDPEMMDFMLENYQAMHQQRETPTGEAFTDFPDDIYEHEVNLTAAEAYALTKQSTEKSAAKRKNKKVSKGEAAAIINKEVADRRTAYEATMPEWLREMK
jgi:hypothetical protein